MSVSLILREIFGASASSDDWNPFGIVDIIIIFIIIPPFFVAILQVTSLMSSILKIILYMSPYPK